MFFLRCENFDVKRCTMVDVMNDDDEDEEGLALDSASPRAPDATEPANAPVDAPPERSEATSPSPSAEQKSKPRKPASAASH